MSDRRPVLFLDIDGVLNSEAWNARRGPFPLGEDRAPDDYHIDPQAVSLLNVVVAASGARVVLSSDWRREPWKPGLKRTAAALRRQGATFALEDANPVLRDVDRLERFGAQWLGNFTPRWMECQAWLDAHPEVTCYAVVDDCADFDAPGWRDRLVQTDADVGLTVEDAARLATLLGEGREG